MTRALLLFALLVVGLVLTFVPATAAPTPLRRKDEPRATKQIPEPSSGTIEPHSRDVVEPAIPQLRGRVCDESGNPLAGAEITITFGVPDVWSEPLGVVQSGQAGGFAADAEPLLAVSASQRGALKVTVDGFLTGHTAANVRLDVAEALAGIELQLPRLDPTYGHLSGTVHDIHGRALRSAIVCRDDRPHETYAMTDAHGRFAELFTDEFANGPPHTLYAYHPDLGSSEPQLVALPRAGQRRVVDFVIPVGEPQVEGFVQDLLGRPVEGVRFRLELVEPGGTATTPRLPEDSTYVRSDAAGRFALRGHRPGAWSVQLSRYGDGSFFLVGDDPPPRVVTGADLPFVFRLEAVPVDFEIVDEHARPLPAAIVHGTVAPPPGSTQSPIEYTLARERRMWLPPGCTGTWNAAAAGTTPRSGTFRTDAGHVVVRAVLAPE